MEQNTVLSVLKLYTNNGGVVNCIDRRSYLKKEERQPNNMRIELRFGVPKQIRTPEYIYDINIGQHGDAVAFMAALNKKYNIEIVSPCELAECHRAALIENVSYNRELILTISKK